MKQVLVCQYVNCLANGSEKVLAAFLEHCNLEHCNSDIEIIGSECQGQCNMGPTVRVPSDKIWYCRVKSEDVPEIVEQHLHQGQPVDRLLHPRFHPKYSP